MHKFNNLKSSYHFLKNFHARCGMNSEQMADSAELVMALALYLATVLTSLNTAQQTALHSLVNYRRDASIQKSLL